MEEAGKAERITAQFQLLKNLWNTGVAAASGERAVAEALKQDGPFPASLVIAVGKAACSMYRGAAPCISASTRSIIVTKHHHVDPGCRAGEGVEIIEAGHPLPDENSLLAGEKVLRAIEGANASDRLLLLVSGGASALVEALKPGHDLAQLQAINASLLGSGKPIREMNDIRSGLSRIKGGKLLAEFRGAAVRVYAVSDVQGDALATIGSGIGDPRNVSASVAERVIAPVIAHVVASNGVARNAVASEARSLGLQIRINEESLYKDVSTLALEIAERLTRGLSGIYIWGGEPTIELPADPGTGGRNQSLALAIAAQIRGTRGISVLAAGTDGTDGPTECAGAFVDGDTVDDADEAERALQICNAGDFLGKRYNLFTSGPTGTNVMDLVIATVA